MLDYKTAGVDIEAGYKAVELMKEHVKKTMRPEVMGGLGGFAGAFSLSSIKEMENQTGLKIPMEKWNPNGGAIAIGHPNGASGARIAGFAINQLKQIGGKYGVFATCCGGGNGVACIIENV